MSDLKDAAAPAILEDNRGERNNIQQGRADAPMIPRPFAFWADPVCRPVRAAYIRALLARRPGVCNPERAHNLDKIAAARTLWHQGVPEDVIRKVVGIASEAVNA